MSVLHAAVFAIGCLVAFMVSWRQPGLARRRIGRLALFIALLLVVGALFNGLWSCSIYNCLYHSADYIFDFAPFWPVWWISVDTPWGDGHGELFTSLSLLKSVWLLFAVGTWAVTILLYQRMRRRLPPNPPAAASPMAALRVNP
jgi:hypothetical protein